MNGEFIDLVNPLLKACDAVMHSQTNIDTIIHDVSVSANKLLGNQSTITQDNISIHSRRILAFMYPKFKELLLFGLDAVEIQCNRNSRSYCNLEAVSVLINMILIGMESFDASNDYREAAKRLMDYFPDPTPTPTSPFDDDDPYIDFNDDGFI
jgi:hypothetical protein